MEADVSTLWGYAVTAWVIGFVGSHKLLTFKKLAETST